MSIALSTILAPNLRRPLSGNKYTSIVVTLLCTLLVLTSCDPQGRTRRTPNIPSKTVESPEKEKTGEVVEVPSTTPEVDTIKIVEDDPKEIPDLELPTGPEGAVVSIMMPFFSSKFVSSSSSLPKNADWAVEYYAGLKLGIEDLDRDGERAQIHVFDTNGDAGTSAKLLNDLELRESHVLIAPYLTSNVKAMISPAQAAGLPVIVPYSAAANLSNQYPRLLQMNPGLARHLDEMAVFLHKNYDAAQVILVGLPNGEQNKEVAYLLKRQRELSTDEPQWRTWQLENGDVGLQDLNWDDKFSDSAETIFVFPAYKNPKIVFSFMGQLQIGRAGRKATILGMPQWAEFSELDPSIMQDLAVKITAGFFIDQNDQKVLDFERRYADRYGKIPELSAYLGYDDIMFSVPLANDYGRKWPENLPRSYKGLVSDYRFVPTYDNGGSGDGKSKADRMENTSIKILQYRDFRFQAMRD